MVRLDVTDHLEVEVEVADLFGPLDDVELLIAAWYVTRDGVPLADTHIALVYTSGNADVGRPAVHARGS